MSFNHRLPALAVATLASVALTFCVLGAMVCDFVEVNARPGALVVSDNNPDLMAVRATFGVFCQDLFYDGNDQMWELSQIFFYVSSCLGGIAVVLAWAVSIVIPPTFFNWRLLSVLSAFSAVLQVPIFLILEAGPCRMSKVQTCTLSAGAYYLIVSTAVWVIVTFGTQFLDPPLWAVELSAWRIPKNRAQHTIIEETDEELGTNRSQFKKVKMENRQSRKNQHVSLQSDLSLPAVSTESMKDEDFDFINPSRSSDTSDSFPREVNRPANNKQNSDANRVSHAIADSTTRLGDEGWIDPVPPKSVNGDISYLQPSLPSQSNERIHIVSSEAPRSPRSPDRRSRSGSVGSKRSRTRGPLAAPTSSMILADLNAHASLVLASSPVRDTTKEEYSDRIPLTSSEKNPTEKYSLTIRALTRKLKKDSRRRRTRRQRRRNGYENMLDDDDDDSDDDFFMSPPIEVKIQPFANFESADFNQEFTDDENEELMDGWKALHKATAVGVRKGLQEEYGQDDEKIHFDDPVQEYHSDPEPAYHSSDSSRSQVSLSELKGSKRPVDQDQEDNSTLSDSSGSRARSVDGKKTRGRAGRRKRKLNSPNVSVKSGGSLLDVTIDEETDQDVMEEISVGDEGLQGILGAYKMERTLSEPLPRQTDYLYSRPARENLETISLDKSRLRTRPQTDHSPKVVGFSSTLERPFTTPTELVAVRKMPPTTSPNISSTPNSLSLPGLENVERNDTKFPQQRRLSSSTLESQASPLRKYMDIKSRSPGRFAQMDVETLQNENAIVQENNRTTTVTDEESTTQSVRSTHSNQSNLSKRAREYRIRRMQHLKKSAEARSAGTPSPPGGSTDASSDGRVTGNEKPQPISSRISRPSYEDGQGIYAEIVEGNPATENIARAEVPYTATRHVDFSDLMTDAPRTSLPKFTANVRADMNHSPTPEVLNRISPELSPILRDEMENMPEEKDFPTLTTTASTDSPTPEYTSFANYEAEAMDDFPVDTDIGLMTGTLHQEESSQEQFLADEDFGKYGSFEMDELDLQLIAVRRPIGKEYGEDEVSL